MSADETAIRPAPRSDRFPGAAPGAAPPREDPTMTTTNDPNPRGQPAPGGVVTVHQAARETDTAIPEAYNLDRDRVRFGPVVAGLLTALTTLLLLGLLGVALGLTAVNAGDAAARGDAGAGTGAFAAVWGALTGLIAFGLGGGTAVAGAGIGAAAGGLAGALVGMGLPEADAQRFEEGFNAGGVLVTVNGGARAADARAVLERHGADTGGGAPA